MSGITARHPNATLIEIVGIKDGSRGRSCEEHDFCGTALYIDAVVRLRAIQIMNDQEQEEAAIGVFWVTDGIDRCLVGFLPRHCIPHRRDFDGRLAQIIEFLEASTNPAERARSQRLRGACMAALIDAQHS